MTMKGSAGDLRHSSYLYPSEGLCVEDPHVVHASRDAVPSTVQDDLPPHEDRCMLEAREWPHGCSLDRHPDPLQEIKEVHVPEELPVAALAAEHEHPRTDQHGGVPVARLRHLSGAHHLLPGQGVHVEHVHVVEVLKLAVPFVKVSSEQHQLIVSLHGAVAPTRYW
eukprot:scaffold78_cov265-Pinguiococcus_pyrenoidosus.AAC.5